MKIAKVVLECFATLAVTGIMTVGVLWGYGLIGQTATASEKNTEYAANAAIDTSPNSASEIRRYDPSQLETVGKNNNGNVVGMESPDFQDTIEKMRRLDSGEIDDMYEQFKSEVTDCQYDTSLFETADENGDEGVDGVESLDFQNTIEKMRRLSSDEIDDMYEQFKNEMPD